MTTVRRAVRFVVNAVATKEGTQPLALTQAAQTLLNRIVVEGAAMVRRGDAGSAHDAATILFRNPKAKLMLDRVRAGGIAVDRDSLALLIVERLSGKR